MKPQYVVSDAGQARYMPGETNDCTVKALVHATGIPYSEAHSVMAAVGRPYRRGGPIVKGMRRLMATNPQWLFERDEETVARWPKPTLAQWLRTHRTGVFIVITRDHAFTVRDGIVYDNFRTGMRRRIWTAYRVSERTGWLARQEYPPTKEA